MDLSFRASLIGAEKQIEVPWKGVETAAGEAKAVEESSSRLIGHSWMWGGFSRRERGSADCLSGTYVFAEVVVHAGALGFGSGCGRVSGWARLEFNRDDPVETKFAADLQRSVLCHVASSTCKGFTVPCGMHRAERFDEALRPQSGRIPSSKI